MTQKIEFGLEMCQNFFKKWQGSQKQNKHNGE
jgi:hypothetical protein